MKNMHTCLLCLGSNVRPEFHLREAREALDGLFPGIRWGSIVPTRAESAEGSPDYLNRMASFDTTLSQKEVNRILKDIETASGRTPGDKKAGRIPLDIDLIQYGTQVLRPSDLGKEYVRKALEGFLQKPAG